MIFSNIRTFYLLLFPPCIYLNLYGFSNIGSIISVVSLFFVFMYFLIRRRIIHIQKNKIAVIVVMLIYVIYIYYNNSLNNLSAIGGLFWWLFFIFSLLLPIKINKNDYFKVVKSYFFVSIVVLSCDAYYRFFINVKDISGIGRYAYKYGLIGIDSNFAGVYALLCFSFFLFLFKKGKISMVYSLIYFFFILASCSVAAITVSLFMFVFFLFKKIEYKIFIITFIFILSNVIVGFINSDGSGGSKFELINEAYNLYMSYDIFNMLFGTGLGSVIFNISHLPPHLLLLQLILEFGLIGFLLFFMIPIVIVLKWGKDYMYIYMPYFLVGLSVVTISNPILTTLSLLYYYFKEIEWEN